MDNNIRQNSPQLNPNNQNPIDFFSSNQTFVYVYKKTEKLATALYMVTNLFGDSEPMKWTLRTKVSHLLSFVLGFKDILRSREHEFVHEVKTNVLEIVSLLDVASKAGLVSAMNFSILKNEFMNLVQVLSEVRKDSDKEYELALPRTFFEDGTSLPKKDTSEVSTKIFTYKPHTSHTHVVKDNTTSEMSFKKNNRQTIILNLLKKKSDLTIKDIAEVITDCSEKTIQRELISLISMGAIKKTGERRWSRYSLI